MASKRPASTQVIFIQQGGRNRHEHICESLELFAEKVLPDFAEHETRREAEKDERIAPHLEAAMARKEFLPPLPDPEIPEIVALGRRIMEERAKQEANIANPAGNSGIDVPLEDPLRD